MKTLVYWIGLILFALACIAVFQLCWFFFVVAPYSGWNYLKGIVPLFFGAFIFAVIGLYMMKEESVELKE